MQTTVCRGCRRPLLDENGGRNVFDDDSVIKSFDSDGSYNKKWSIKLYTGIELITGQKVTREDMLPQKLCELCFQNVEAYINFRFQLLRSRDILLCSSYADAKVEANNKPVEAENLILLNSSICNVGSEDVMEKKSEISVFKSELFTSPLLSKSVITNSITKTLSEDLINVDDSSTSLDVNSPQNEDEETTDSMTCRLQNDQENNNLNDSDDSVDNAIISNVENANTKQQDHDIESEIDVCSGEDDDVLELDVQKIKNETVEINSSSESDIEVCDYEPTGKRGNYNTLSPAIRY